MDAICWMQKATGHIYRLIGEDHFHPKCIWKTSKGTLLLKNYVPTISSRTKLGERTNYSTYDRSKYYHSLKLYHTFLRNKNVFFLYIHQQVCPAVIYLILLEIVLSQ